VVKGVGGAGVVVVVDKLLVVSYITFDFFLIKFKKVNFIVMSFNG
jgi:hypothetical protein